MCFDIFATFTQDYNVAYA